MWLKQCQLSDLTLKATWEEIEFTITYYFYVGTEEYVGSIENLNPTKYTLLDNVVLVNPTAFDAAYYFVAWYTDSTFTTEATGFEAGQTGEKAFYGLLRSYVEAFDEDTNTLIEKYEDTLTGELTTLPALDLTLPNGTKVSWQSSSTAVKVDPETGEVTITRPADEDETVFLTAILSFGDCYDVIYFEFVVPADQYVEVYSTGFENSTKTSYASANVLIDDVNWNLNEALIGTEANDKKDGSQSVRARIPATATMLSGFEGLAKIAFKYGAYGSDSNGNTISLKLEISKDGENWIEIFFVEDVDGNLTYHEIELDYSKQVFVDNDITLNSNIRLKFTLSGTSAKRCNIDSITLYAFKDKAENVAKVEEDVDLLPSTFGNKSDVFELPSVGTNGSSISWEVLEGTAVVIENNVVTQVNRPASYEEDVVVKLLATFTLNGIERTKEVTVTILKLEKTDAEKIAEDIEELEELNGEIIAGNTLILPNTGKNGSAISWEANPEGLIDEEGVVGKDLLANTTLTLTATLTLGEETETVEITINILVEIAYGTVAEARSAELDSEVRVKGVVTSIIGNNVFIQDETAGIYLYLGNDASFANKLVIGNEVGIIGTKAEYANLQQISSILNVEVLGTKDVPTSVIFDEIDNVNILEKEGQLATLNNVTIQSIPTIGTNSYSVVVTDGTNTLELRVDKSIAAFTEVKELFESLTVGQKLQIVGAPIGRYNDTLQLMISNVDQIVMVELSAAEKIALAIAEIESFDGQTVTGNLVLPTEGLHGVVITWESSNPDIISETGEVTRPAVGEDDATVTLTATFSVDEVEEEVAYIVIVKAEQESSGEPVTVTAAYSGDTTNMTDGNNASTIGLDSTLFTVLSVKGGQTNHIGLNKDGQIRLYGQKDSGNGSTLQISIVEGYKITSVVFEFGASTNNATGELKLGSETIDLSANDVKSTTKTYTDLDITSFSLQNTHMTSGSVGQVWILSIQITYVPVN
ncbi:MAG: immunoglobulin-like domain-containing protein [Bacilli bacterium]